MEHHQKNINELFRIFPACGVIIIFWLILSSTVSAQQLEDRQDEIIEKAFVKAVSIYNTEIGRNSMVYTGSGYYGPYNGIRGHQYFIDDYWEQGSLIYDGHAFDSIFLKYDVYRDLLIIENFNSNGFLSPIQLYSPKVSSFDLMGYYFIRLEKDTISNIRAGFYNQMYKSKDMEVLVKRRKEIINSNEINSIREEFTIKDRYYIKKNGMFYRVKKKRSVLKVLEDQKKEIKRFIRKNNFRFKFRPDNQLVEVVKYYDSLF